MKKKHQKLLDSTFRILSTTFIIAFTFYIFLFSGEVVGSSMNSTLFEGNIVYGINYKTISVPIERGRVLAIEKKIYGQDEKIVKRVVGIPGDLVSIRNNELYINGEFVEEAYIREPMIWSEKSEEIILSEDEYFVMGDNRNDSMDSRHFGPVNKDEIMSVLYLSKQSFTSSPFNIHSLYE